MPDPSLCVSVPQGAISPPLVGAELSVPPHSPWTLQGQARHRWAQVALGAGSASTNLLGTADQSPPPQQLELIHFQVWGWSLHTNPILHGCCSSVPTSGECLPLTWAGDKLSLVSPCLAMANPCKRQAWRSLDTQGIHRPVSSLRIPLCSKECTQCPAGTRGFAAQLVKLILKDG